MSTLIVVAGLVGLGCERRETEPDKKGPAPATIETPAFELVGCRHREGPRCHLLEGRDATLVIWLDVHAGASLRAKLDALPFKFAAVPVDGGVRVRVDVPASVQSLQIEGVDPRWSTPLTLELVREPLPAYVIEAKDDASDEAIARLRAGSADADPLVQLAAKQALRRHLVRRGDPEALAETEATAQLARELGRSRDFADAAAAAAFLHLSNQDLVSARAWVEQLRTATVTDGSGHGAAEIPIWAHYQLGLLASRTGDLGAAVEHLDEARRAARRVALHDEFIFASEILGVSYAELGRGAEAEALIEEILDQASALSDCKQRAELYANTGWASLLLAEAGFDHHAHDPRSLFEAQIELIGPEGACPDPVSMSFVRVNLALVAIADREYDEAWDWIAPLSFEHPPSYLAPWVDEVIAQVGVGAGRWELVPSIVARPAPDTSEPGLQWNATVRQAETLAGLGLSQAALVSYAEAEGILERTLSSVGVSLGRELFLAGRQTSAQRLVELLLARGETAAALCRARLARGRALRTLDRSTRIAALSPEQRREREAKLSRYLAIQTELAAAQREDWAFSGPERERRARLRDEREAEAEALLDEALRGTREAPKSGADPCAGLPPIEPGQVLLMQFPSEVGSWLFVADQSGVGVIEAPDPSAGPWPEDILAGHSERIAAAERIHVIPTGAGWSIDFHALEVGEGVLLEVAPLIYSLDLHSAREGPASPGRALVVANPSEDLANAQAEAKEVAARLSEGAWAVEQRVGAEVTRATLEAELGEAELLHYAGHGVHRGADGWQAALLLHDQDVLTVSDILAQPRVPAGVVLTGCDTTSVARGTLAGGMNLGRAFVLAGANWVIGADGKVDDALARALGEALYASSGSTTTTLMGAEFDGPAALREAQLALRSRQPEGGWRAFRAVGP